MNNNLPTPEQVAALSKRIESASKAAKSSRLADDLEARSKAHRDEVARVKRQLGHD